MLGGTVPWAGEGHPMSHEGDAGGVAGVGPDMGHKAHLDDGDRRVPEMLGHSHPSANKDATC